MTAAPRLCLSALLMLTALPALAQGIRYENPRFGFTVTLPELEQKGGGAWTGPFIGQATDGASFRMEGHKVELVASGAYLWQDSFAQAFQMAQDFAREDGGTVTYKASGADWFVVSGLTADGHIYYRRSLLTQECFGDPLVVTMALTYGQDERWIDGSIGAVTKAVTGCTP